MRQFISLSVSIMNPCSHLSVSFSVCLLLSLVTSILSNDVKIKNGLKNYREIEIQLQNVKGPESLAFDCHGKGPYVSVSDGRILKWEGAPRAWKQFAVTSPNRDKKLCDGSTDPSKEPKCGRPLGLKFHPKTCDLYIADAYFGLVVVGPQGGVAKQLAISTDDGVPFKFLNSLDIDPQTGLIYFSDTSTVYQRREWPQAIQTGDKTGRLLKYDPSTKKVQVLLKHLAFANGVALSKDYSFILIALTNSKEIIKFWLKGSKAFTSETFAKLERPPDNIKRNEKRNSFWVAVNSGRGPLNPGNATSENEVNKLKKEDPVGLKFDQNGKLLEILDGEGEEELDSVSEVCEHNGKLWIGSVVKSYVAVIKI